MFSEILFVKVFNFSLKQNKISFPSLCVFSNVVILGNASYSICFSWILKKALKRYKMYKFIFFPRIY